MLEGNESRNGLRSLFVAYELPMREFCVTSHEFILQIDWASKHATKHKLLKAF